MAVLHSRTDQVVARLESFEQGVAKGLDGAVVSGFHCIDCDSIFSEVDGKSIFTLSVAIASAIVWHPRHLGLGEFFYGFGVDVASYSND